MPNGKVMILHLIVELIKRIFLYKIIYFPPYGHSKNEIKIDLDSCSYVTESHLKMQQVQINQNLLKNYLANLKSEVDKLSLDELKNVPGNLNSLKSKVDKLDIDNFKAAPFDSKKLSEVVGNDVVKKTLLYDELAKKANAIDPRYQLSKQIIMLRSITLKMK